MVCLGLRRILDTPDERTSFLKAIESDAEFEATKVVLALKIQRASKSWHAEEYGLDDSEQVAWRRIMDDMADCRFEGEGGNEALVEAIGQRLKMDPEAMSAGGVDPTRASIASALKALKFVELGL